MSETEKQIVETPIQANLLHEPESSGNSWQLELSEKVSNLLFPSESDRPIEIVDLGTGDNSENLIKEHVQAKREGELQPDLTFAEFKDKYGVEKDWQSPGRKEFARNFGEALDTLGRHLTDLQVFRHGNIEVDLYIVGRDQDNRWRGLKTTVVETGD